MTATRPMSALRQRMIQDLQLTGRSERTQEAYVRAVRKLAAHYRQSPDRLTEPQVRDYFLYLKNDRRFSPSALKIAHSGIKFFYTHSVPRAWATLWKLRVPKQKTLPDVLTIDEVHRLLDAVRTPHNRAFLWTVYSLVSAHHSHRHRGADGVAWKLVSPFGQYVGALA